MMKDTYQLIGAVKQMYPVMQFFKDRYFPDGRNFYSEEVVIDSKKQGQKIAPFVVPLSDGITMENEGYRTDILKAPMIAVKKPITPEDVWKRSFGEDPNSNRSPASRQNEILADNLDQMRNAILRRHEKMCTDIITTGKTEIDQYASADDAAKGKNAVKAELRFYDSTFGNRHITGKIFANMTAAEKIKLFYDMATVMRKRGFTATDLVLTSDVAATLFGDSDFLDYYDKLRLFSGVIEPEELPDGVVKSGTVNVRGVALTIYIYDAEYVDLDGSSKPFLPTGFIGMLRPNIGKTVYGQVTFVKGDSLTSYADKIVPRVVASENDNIIMTQMFSRPVPYPEFTDGWLVADATKAN